MNADLGDNRGNPAKISKVIQSANRWLVATAFGLVVFSSLAMLLSFDEWPSSDESLVEFTVNAVREGGVLAVIASAVALTALVLLLGRLPFFGSKGGRRPKKYRWWILAAFIVFSVSTLTTGWLQVNSMLKAFRLARLEQQLVIARQKAVQIDDWTAERLIDLRFLVDTLKSLPLRSVSGDENAKLLAEVVLSQFLSSYSERVAAGVFLADGQSIVAQGRFDPAWAASLREEVRTAAGIDKPLVGAVQSGGIRTGGASVAFLEAIRSSGQDGTLQPLVVVTVIDPTVLLLRKFSEWPAPGRGTLDLVVRQGDKLAYIVDGASKTPAAPLVLTAPVPPSRADKNGFAGWPSESGVTGFERDGGMNLVAAFEAQGQPWLVVARTDPHDALAPVARQVRIIWAMTVVVVIFGGLLMLAVSTEIKLANTILES